MLTDPDTAWQQIVSASGGHRSASPSSAGDRRSSELTVVLGAVWSPGLSGSDRALCHVRT